MISYLTMNIFKMDRDIQDWKTKLSTAIAPALDEKVQ